MSEENVDVEAPEVQEILKAKVEEATNGLASKNAELLGKINESKSKMEEMQQKLAQFESVDMEKFTKMQKYFEENEDAKLIAEGRIDEVIERKTKNVLQSADARIEAINEEREELARHNQNLKAQYDNLIVSQNISNAAVKVGIVPEAIDDVLIRASNVFKVDDDGKPRAYDQDGNMILGKKGDPITPSEWVTGLKDTAPHYFPSSQSGGHGFTPSQADANVLDAAKSGNLAAFRKARRKQRS